MQVEGLEKTDVAMRIGFVGCPVEFQPTATYGRTLARYKSCVHFNTLAV